MRKVERRLTFKRRTCGAPWSWRSVFQTGAPRTALSNQRVPVHHRIDDEHVLEIGSYDWLTRLYQHRGLSRNSVRPEGGVAYFEEEWEFIRSRECEWIEYVDDLNETVLRIDFQDASRYGSWVSTPRGSMWTVPTDYYTLSE